MQLIILDRDGVINRDSADYIKNAAEWQALPGSLGAIARLNKAGYRVVVISNQSGIARGKFSRQDLDAIHAKLCDELRANGGHVDAILYCPHGPVDGCRCRKPEPGLFLEAMQRFEAPTDTVIAVGDKASDIEAARRAGITQTVLVKTGLSPDPSAGCCDLKGVPEYPDLAAMVEVLLERGAV